MSKTQDQLDKLVSGDEEAWRKVAKEYLPKIMIMSQSLHLGPATCEDITQETLMCAYTYIKQLKDPNKFNSWIMELAKRIIYRNLSREKKYIKIYDTFLTTKEPWMELEKKDLIYALQQAIPFLTPEQRDFVNLYYVRQMSPKEISILVGSNENYVRVVLCYARKKLRDLLKKKTNL